MQVQLATQFATRETKEALTKREVDDDVVCAEVARHVARRRGEVRGRRTPLGRVDLLGAIGDVRGDALVVARPEPDLDARVRALHRVEAATVVVEREPVRLRGPVEHGAARVSGRRDVAVRLHGMTGHLARTAHRAACGLGSMMSAMEGRGEGKAGAPAVVWSVIWLVPWPLTPSTMSISPAERSPSGLVKLSNARIGKNTNLARASSRRTPRARARF